MASAVHLNTVTIAARTLPFSPRCGFGSPSTRHLAGRLGVRQRLTFLTYPPRVACQLFPGDVAFEDPAPRRSRGLSYHSSSASAAERVIRARSPASNAELGPPRRGFTKRGATARDSFCSSFIATRKRRAALGLYFGDLIARNLHGPAAGPPKTGGRSPKKAAIPTKSAGYLRLIRGRRPRPDEAVRYQLG